MASLAIPARFNTPALYHVATRFNDSIDNAATGSTSPREIQDPERDVYAGEIDDSYSPTDPTLHDEHRALLLCKSLEKAGEKSINFECVRKAIRLPSCNTGVGTWDHRDRRGFTTVPGPGHTSGPGRIASNCRRNPKSISLQDRSHSRIAQSGGIKKLPITNQRHLSSTAQTVAKNAYRLFTSSHHKPALGAYESDYDCADIQLKFKAQYAVISSIQQLLESSIYNWATRWFPESVQGRGYATAEAVELHLWGYRLQKFRGVKSKHLTNSFKALDVAYYFNRLIDARHLAVHRRSGIPVEALHSMCSDAVCLSRAFGDPRAVLLNFIQEKVLNLSQELVGGYKHSFVQADGSVPALEFEFVRAVKNYESLVGAPSSESDLVAYDKHYSQTKDTLRLLSGEAEYYEPRGALNLRPISKSGAVPELSTSAIFEPVLASGSSLISTSLSPSTSTISSAVSRSSLDVLSDSDSCSELTSANSRTPETKTGFAKQRDFGKAAEQREVTNSVEISSVREISNVEEFTRCRKESAFREPVKLEVQIPTQKSELDQSLEPGEILESEESLFPGEIPNSSDVAYILENVLHCGELSGPRQGQSIDTEKVPGWEETAIATKIPCITEGPNFGESPPGDVDKIDAASLVPEKWLLLEIRDLLENRFLL